MSKAFSEKSGRALKTEQLDGVVGHMAWVHKQEDVLAGKVSAANDRRERRIQIDNMLAVLENAGVGQGEVVLHEGGQEVRLTLNGLDKTRKKYRLKTTGLGARTVNVSRIFLGLGLTIKNDK